MLLFWLLFLVTSCYRSLTVKFICFPVHEMIFCLPLCCLAKGMQKDIVQCMIFVDIAAMEKFWTAHMVPFLWRYLLAYFTLYTSYFLLFLIFVLLKYIFKNKVIWLEWDNFLCGLHLEKGLTLDLKPIWCSPLSWMHKSVFYLLYLSRILACCWLNCSSFTLR